MKARMWSVLVAARLIGMLSSVECLRTNQPCFCQAVEPASIFRRGAWFPYREVRCGEGEELSKSFITLCLSHNNLDLGRRPAISRNR